MSHQLRVGISGGRILGKKADLANSKVKAVVEAHDALKSAIDDMKDYHEDVSNQGQPEDGGEDDTAQGGSAQTVKQNRAAKGTVASPTACQLADGLRKHYEQSDLRAASKTKSTSREDAIRAAMTPPAITE